MAPRNFACRSCSWCIRAVKWLPVIFITTIVVWSYFAYVVQLCLLTIESLIEKILYITIFHFFFAMFSWSYWQTIFTEIGIVPKEFRLHPAEAEKLEREENDEAQRRMLERLAKDLPVSCRTMTGAIRYCEKCHFIKPDRAHHCSVCGECVLKMDHHCPWVNNCVGFMNYKFFVLFLGYALLYCLYISATTLQYFIKFWRNDLPGTGRFHILFLFFVAIMFAISLISLFGYHCYLVSVNRTTLESFRAPIFRTGPDKDGFSLGRYANLLEVFGDDKVKWFLPLYSSLGDGITYPTRTPQTNSYNSMGNTQTSMGDGVTFPQRLVDDDTDQLLGNRQRWAEDDVEQANDLKRNNQHLEVTVISQRNQPV
uniref:Palmitoyltransferase n=1 Tax=Strigamia maritima TaxID=126957 RepID=T1IPK0_STRMM